MPEEVVAIKNLLTDVQTIELGSRQYFVGQIDNFEVVLTFSRWGKVAAAITATTLVTEFKVDALIFTGVAGSLVPDLGIGDVVVATKLYQHDVDASPLFPKHEIPLTNQIYYETNKKLSQQLFESSNRFIDNIIATPERPVKCVRGVIASGDQFISNMSQLDAEPGTLAVEMEGAAVAQVCAEHTIPFAVVRVISDSADDNAEMDFMEFVAETASRYSYTIVQNFLEHIKIQVTENRG